MRGSEGADAGEAELAWLPVSDALLRGVGHALNNRVAALSAVVQVLTGSGGGGPLEEALGAETARLQRSVELLRLLPRRWEDEPEPARVEEVVGAALELLPLHYDLPELRYRWEATGELPPVLVEPSLLTHVLCVLGTAAARAAEGGEEVVFRGSATPAGVTVEVAAGAAAVAELEALVARAGGTLRVADGRTAALTLPTLAEARRRDRAEGGGR